MFGIFVHLDSPEYGKKMLLRAFEKKEEAESYVNEYREKKKDLIYLLADRPDFIERQGYDWRKKSLEEDDFPCDLYSENFKKDGNSFDNPLDDLISEYWFPKIYSDFAVRSNLKIDKFGFNEFIASGCGEI